MKQAKRKKSAAAPEAGVDAVAEPLLPDLEYVEQLLAANEPVAADAAVVVAEVNETAAPQGALTLPAQCLLRDAVEYRQQLLASLAAPNVSVDVAAVERIDTAFMQVLLAFVRSRPADGAAVNWLNMNPVFAEAAQLLGMQGALALPAAA